MSVAGVCYSQLDSEAVERKAQVVADRATCRAVDSAIVAYVGVHGKAPASVAELAGYLKGDITAYRVVGGQAAGPGCS
ncbi:hypothetical protein [Actinoplanes sp. URMC 104]|uniref:hypothetical protein n=1 Tax=Actinoplanes sp. URMC 104 TaxID=3423409 RepID=UPI003F1A4543